MNLLNPIIIAILLISKVAISQEAKDSIAECQCSHPTGYLTTDTALYEEGELKHITYYNDVGEKMYRCFFHKNGRIRSIINFKNNEINGLVLEYYDDGKLKGKRSYQGGLIVGPYWEWYENGQLEKEGKMNDSLITIISYYESGQLKSEEVSTTGFPNSLVISSYWCENGQLITRSYGDSAIYKKVFYHCNGLKAKEGTIINNYAWTGPWREWYDNGQIKAIGGYATYKGIVREKSASNKKVGEWKYWYSNGKRMKREFYDEEGKKQGKWKYYNEKGKLIKTEYYIDDIITSKTN